MVDSQQWRISFFFVLTKCRRLQILVTNIGPNDLKLILHIEETSLYEIILSIIITVLLFSCSSTAKLAKLPQGRRFYPSSYCFTRCRRFDFKVTYYCPNHLKLHMGINKSLITKIYCHLL